MDLLGIDERGKNLKNVRDWYGVRDFFKLKLPEIDDICEQLKSGNGKDRLYSAMLKETSETKAKAPAVSHAIFLRHSGT